MNQPTIDPTADQIRKLAESAGQEGPIVMVNLLRFREKAAAPDEGMAGFEAYMVYAKGVSAHLERVGAKLLTTARCEQSVIGPDQPEWHVVITVEYPSRAAFLEMIADPDYQELSRHRTAALEDSRLIQSVSLT
jgi:uncharacterized protein (DUF1330 family)